MPKKLDKMPRRPKRRVEHDFSYLENLKPWRLERGKDFEETVRIESVRRRVNKWAERNGYTKERGYVVETVVVRVDPKTGKSYRELKGGRSKEKVRPEFGLAVQIRRDREEASRRMRDASTRGAKRS